MLLLFSVAGGPLLAYLGISLGALQVAGGVLLVRIREGADAGGGASVGAPLH